MAKSTLVLARCLAGHEWRSTATESWAVIPPRRSSSKVVTLAVPYCPRCSGAFVSFTAAEHLPAPAAIPAPPPPAAAVLVRARCELGHEWQAASNSASDIDNPVCPSCGRSVVSFQSTRHG